VQSQFFTTLSARKRTVTPPHNCFSCAVHSIPFCLPPGEKSRCRANPLDFCEEPSKFFAQPVRFACKHFTPNPADQVASSLPPPRGAVSREWTAKDCRVGPFSLLAHLPPPPPFQAHPCGDQSLKNPCKVSSLHPPLPPPRWASAPVVGPGVPIARYPRTDRNSSRLLTPLSPLFAGKMGSRTGFPFRWAVLRGDWLSFPYPSLPPPSPPLFHALVPPIAPFFLPLTELFSILMSSIPLLPGRAGCFVALCLSFIVSIERCQGFFRSLVWLRTPTLRSFQTRLSLARFFFPIFWLLFSMASSSSSIHEL